MADMPDSPRPPPRPPPPAPRGSSRDRRGSPRQQQREAHGMPSQTARDQHLRPPEHSPSHGGRNGWGVGAGDRHRRGQSPGFATSKEEFSFDDDMDAGSDASCRHKQSAGRNANVNVNGRGSQNQAGVFDANGSDTEEDDRRFGTMELPEDADEDIDYYAVLNLPSDASSEDIRASYHLLSRRFHPDKQPPALRERATSYFNQILVAYETLIDPQKRQVYDRLGVEGVKQRTWQVGPRGMSPEEFKLWLQDKMAKGREAELAELVGSQGKAIVKADVSGLFFRVLHVKVDEKGNVLSQEVVQPPPFVLQRYQTSHSFRIPLGGLGNFLATPLPTSLSLWAPRRPLPEALSKLNLPDPSLTFEFSLGGAPSKSKKQPEGVRMLSSPGLAASLAHSFPPLPPDSPRSIASLFAGNDIQARVTALPTPVGVLQVTRTFGQNAFVTKSTFVSPTNLPILELQLSRRLGMRHSFFIGVNSGLPVMLPPTNLFSRPPLGEVRPGLASIGYTYHPIAITPDQAGDSDESGSGTNQDQSPPNPGKLSGRSKRSETFTIILANGLMASGAQARFVWGRTFFLGTPLGDAQRRANRGSNVGIRFGFEATAAITGQASWTLKATRKFFSNTAMGVSISAGGATGTQGVTLGFTWARLGQSFSLPLVVAPYADLEMFFRATAAPFLVYTLAEFAVFRPRDKRIRAKMREEVREKLRAYTAERRARAEEAQEFMRAAAIKKADTERAAGGLVVLKAVYGAQEGKKGYEIDVTIPLQAMVESSGLCVPKGTDKGKLLGFYDPAPGMQKSLTVEYLFQGKRHEAVVKGNKGFVAPLRSHRVDGERY